MLSARVLEYVVVANAPSHIPYAIVFFGEALFIVPDCIWYRKLHANINQLTARRRRKLTRILIDEAVEFFPIHFHIS